MLVRRREARENALAKASPAVSIPHGTRTHPPLPHGTRTHPPLPHGTRTHPPPL